MHYETVTAGKIPAQRWFHKRTDSMVSVLVPETVDIIAQTWRFGKCPEVRDAPVQIWAQTIFRDYSDQRFTEERAQHHGMVSSRLQHAAHDGLLDATYVTRYLPGDDHFDEFHESSATIGPSTSLEENRPCEVRSCEVRLGEVRSCEVRLS